MTRGVRLVGAAPGVVAAALGLAWAGTALGQFMVPESGVVLPPPKGALVEIEASWYSPEGFVDTSGTTQRFPGSLDFALAVVRASYSPARHLAFGLVVPYRWTELDLGVESLAVSSRGNPGFGVFADWSPAPCGGRSLCPSVRLGLYHARHDGSPIVTISDGIDRATAALTLAPSLPREDTRWRFAGTLWADFGRTPGIAPRQVDSRLEVELGRAIGRVRSSDLWLFGFAGYRTGTSATQEDIYFHNGTSRSAFAGLRLEWRPASATAERRVVRLSVSRDLRPENALIGWRGAVSVAMFL